MRSVVVDQYSNLFSTNDLDGLYQMIRRDSWKVSGCGLRHGALSCALFIAQYAAMSKQANLAAEIQELFDRSCNSVVTAKISWLDFADLALVTQMLSSQGFIEIEQDHFFEDIDGLALAAMAGSNKISGFENSDLGAGLYALRRYNAGAAQFSGPLGLFASAACSVENADCCNLRYGLSAPLLFVSAVAEIGLVESSALNLGRLVEGVCNHINAQDSTQFNPGFHTGDLGNGYSLLRAGMSFQREEWICAGLQILIDSARAVLDHGIGSLDIASGAAGIALVFNKLYVLTAYGIFREAAARARWLNLNSGIMLPERDIDREFSFYHGVSGIGLATLFGQKNQSEQLDEFLWLL